MEEMEKIEKTEAEWKQQLSPEQYRILRQKGTEPAFSGALYHNEESGSYVCAGCRAPLFSSEAKYESGSGWPSFWAAVSPEAVATHEDTSYGMRRTEILCARCGGHLGHVFPDGPQPTGLRFCTNSGSLDFQKKS